MSENRRGRGKLPWSAEEVFAEEGVDPHQFFFGESGGRHGRSRRKARQLCRQVAWAVGEFLAAECEDPWLMDTMVVSVDPSPDSRRLMVLCQYAGDDPEFDVAEARARLQALRGALRAEVASVIHRKRAPELLLDLLSPGEVRL